MFDEKISEFVKKCANYSHQIYLLVEDTSKNKNELTEDVAKIVQELMLYVTSFKKEYLLALSKDSDLLKFNFEINQCQNILFDTIKHANTYALFKMDIFPKEKNTFFN